MKGWLLLFMIWFSAGCADHIQSDGANHSASQEACAEKLDQSFVKVNSIFASDTYKCIVCHDRYQERSKIEKDIEKIVASVQIEDTSNPAAMPRNRPRLSGSEVDLLKNFATEIKGCK